VDKNLLIILKGILFSELRECEAANSSHRDQSRAVLWVILDQKNCAV
jgi:hypothetical protein